MWTVATAKEILNGVHPFKVISQVWRSLSDLLDLGQNRLVCAIFLVHLEVTFVLLVSIFGKSLHFGEFARFWIHDIFGVKEEQAVGILEFEG